MYFFDNFFQKNIKNLIIRKLNVGEFAKKEKKWESKKKIYH